MTKHYKTLLFISLAILLTPLAGMAAISFDGSGNTVFQQTQNSPCVIGNNSCNQPPGFTAFQDPNGASGGATSYDFTSPVYQAITPFTAPGSYNGNKIPTSFTIGIDENIAAGQGAEVLLFFRTLLCTDATGSSCAVVAANSYEPDTVVPNINNGNGFSDALLTGFSLVANSYYRFEASVGNDTDGMEQFFIIPGSASPVPEPSTIAVSTILLAIGAMARRRLKQS